MRYFQCVKMAAKSGMWEEIYIYAALNSGRNVYRLKRGWNEEIFRTCHLTVDFQGLREV